MLIDLILHFFYAFVNKRQKIVKDFRSICMKYLFGIFIFDLLSLFPYYATGALKSYHFLKIFRFSRASSVLQWMSLVMNGALIRMTSNINFALSLTRITVFSFLLLVTAHFISCVWYWIGFMNMKVSKGWIYTLIQQNSIEYSETTTYISSIYWVFTTLSTLGYGDITPRERYEYLFTMMIEFMGVFLFAYMMGNINNLIEKLDDDHNEYLENELEKLDQWLMKIDRANPRKKLKKEMVSAIKDALETYWKMDHLVVQDNTFLEQLPPKLRDELIEHLFSKFMDTFFIFFEGVERGFQHQVVINLFPRKFHDKEEIISVDTSSKHIYFITKGTVRIGSKNGIAEYVELPEYSYFGDYLFFFRLKSSNAF